MWIYVKTVLQLIKVWIFRDVDISFKSLVNFISTHESGDIGVKAFMWGSAQMVVFMMTYIWADGLSAVFLALLKWEQLVHMMINMWMFCTLICNTLNVDVNNIIHSTFWTKKYVVKGEITVEECLHIDKTTWM